MTKFKLFKPPSGEEKKHAYHSRLEKKLGSVLTPFEEFSQSQISASIFLLSATIIALVIANVPAWSGYYYKMIHFPVNIVLGRHQVGGDLRFWVNDILLTFFFFLVGLEIKREFIAGELVNRKRAFLILFAAFGGMLFPAIIFTIFNYGLPSAIGWGIPMATDTAFALGILAIFRQKLPKGIFTFMASLAIIDDIGAIIIIVAFYSQQISLTYLLSAFVFLLLLSLGNFAGIRHTIFYLIGGAIIWYCFEYAGIHGVIAGVLVALCIPARPSKGPIAFVNKVKDLLDYFEKRKKKIPKVIADKKQHVIIEEVEETAKKSTTPLQRLETKLDLPVSLFVLPIFALFNAGIMLHYDAIEKSIHSPLTWGVITGLFLGKPIGILLLSFIALKLNLGAMPKKTNFKHLVGASLLGGVGFTMSLVISNLAFINNNDLLEIAKTGILFGSVLSGIIGIIWLAFIKNTNSKSW